MPLCQIHIVKHCTDEKVEATYDARVKGISSWTYMCDSCFETHGSKVFHTKLDIKQDGPNKI